MSISTDLGMPPVIAIIVVMMMIATTVFGVRAVGRRQRLRARRGRAELTRTVAAFFDDTVGAADLLRAMDAADAGTAWTVLESLPLKLDRAEWLRLSTALTRLRHAAAERRALTDDSPW
ncbi:MAG: hypothetical protein HY076_04515, partial [Candidatus Eisenbacteria bacterium]|nr:hypothetical protein [Candidatus Eisenbacteria bacterium]